MDLLQRIEAASFLLPLLLKYIALEDGGWGVLLADPRMRAAIDGEIDRNVVAQVSLATTRDPLGVESTFISLSLGSDLLPPHPGLVLPPTLPWEEMAQRLFHPELPQRLCFYERSFQQHTR